MAFFIEPSIEIFFHYPPGHMMPGGVERFLEKVGRTCYKSEERITKDSAHKFVSKLNRMGHHAMLEHCVASAKLICDRGVSHELVRHRLASFAQESSRYCDYCADGKHGGVTFIIPPELDETTFPIWKEAMLAAEVAYNSLREKGVPPQIARGVLPTDLKTEIWITANLREWAHIFELRCSSAAHPHIRRLMLEAQREFSNMIPSMFGSEA